MTNRFLRINMLNLIITLNNVMNDMFGRVREKTQFGMLVKHMLGYANNRRNSAAVVFGNLSVEPGICRDRNGLD
ncbi:hypothetical protein D3C74_448260 [compost metagenome]